MKSFQFQRLVLVSDSKKSANQFKFGKKINLVTGTNNSIGKSTLVKNLFWALGCEPTFDIEWKSNDCKALLEFSIDGKNYVAVREKNTIVFGFKGEELTKYFKISGPFSQELAKAVSFNAKLPNRNEQPELETPPPAFYFLPFYMDQLHSWDKPWNSFEGLGQYKNWKPTIAKYFSGYYSSEHFDLEEEVYEQKDIKKGAENQIARFDTTLEVVSESTPRSILSVEIREQTRIDITEELRSFVVEENQITEQLTDSQNKRYELEKQIEILRSAAMNLEEDYKFAVESTDGDLLECPLCGVEHDNSLASRSVLLAEKDQATYHLENLEQEYINVLLDIGLLNEQLLEVNKKAEYLNNKYMSKDEGVVEKETNDIFCEIASTSLTQEVESLKVVQSSVIQDATTKEKKVKKEQTQLLSKNDKQSLSDNFMAYFLENIGLLNAKGINLSSVTKATDYNKIFGGGAAEGTRAILAYYLSILSLIHDNDEIVPAPLVIDTPNQQEQAEHNYETIINVIMSKIPRASQLILCGMENPALRPFKQEANIIELSDNKLLCTESYAVLEAEVSAIQESATRHVSTA